MISLPSRMLELYSGNTLIKKYPIVVDIIINKKIQFLKQYKGILSFLAKYNKVGIKFLRWWLHAS